MSPSRILASVVVAAAVLVPAAPSQAASSFVCTGYSACRDAGMRGYTYQQDQGAMYWNMFPGTNCTNYVAWRLIKSNGLPNKRPKPGVGNARDWGKQLPELTTSTPAVGSVAWWGYNGKSHVAYVEKVESASSIVISESNYGMAFDHRRITRGTGWPDGFIHFTTGSLKTVTKPTISGSAVTGGTLKVTLGTTKPAATSQSVQWLRDGKAIKGATARTFTNPASAVGHRIRVRVTSRRTHYATSSADAADVRVASGTFTAPQPTIEGTAKVDRTLTASAGTWKPTRGTSTYQWSLDGRVVAGATRSTFTPGPESVGRAVTVKVTGTKPGFTTRSVTSASSAAIALGDLRATSRPVVTGGAQVDRPLRVSAPTWDKTGVQTTWQWLRDGQPVVGATSAEYTPGPADVGRRVTVQARGSRTGYAVADTTSTTNAVVQPGRFTSIGTPQLTGEPRVGAPLRAEPGSWSPDATFAYQWLVDGRPVPRAIAQDYVPDAARLGHRISVRVTASRDGYTSVSRTTAPTTTVGRGSIVVAARPTITGRPRLRSVLTARPGTVAPSGATPSYQWLRDGTAIPGATTSRRWVRTSDLGHLLSVRVTYRAAGYATRSVTSEVVARATAASTISARPTSTTRGRLSVPVRVQSSGPVPTGRVTIDVAGRVSSARLDDGVATLVLAGLAPGAATVTISYAGDTRTAASTRSVTTTIR